MANSTARRSSKTELTEDTKYLVERNRYLEKEVETLKSRLDTLRAAKNNTVIKNTTKFVPTSEPKTHDGSAELARKQEKENDKDLQKRLKDLDELLEKERKVFKAEIESLQKMKLQEAADVNCEQHEQLIQSLQTENISLQVQLAEREADNHCLVEDLTKKEAEWCETEERYKQECGNLKADYERLQQLLARLASELPQLQQTTSYLHGEISRNNPNTQS